MARKKRKVKKAKDKDKEDVGEGHGGDVGKGIMAFFLVFAIFIFILSFLGSAGAVGEFIKDQSDTLTGIGMPFIPVFILLLAISFVKPIGGNRSKVIFLSTATFFVGFLGFLSTIGEGSGGSIGDFMYTNFNNMLGGVGSFLFTILIMATSFSIAFKVSLMGVIHKFKSGADNKESEIEVSQEEIDSTFDPVEDDDVDEDEVEEEEEEGEKKDVPVASLTSAGAVAEKPIVVNDGSIPGSNEVLEPGTSAFSAMDTSFRLTTI